MSNLLEKASIVTTPTAYDNGKILSVKPEEVLGEELVVNGDFENGNTGWSEAGDFAISGGKASITSASQYSQLTSQLGTNFLTSGKQYKLQVDIETLSISGVFAYRVTGGAVNPILTSDLVGGVYTAYFTMTSDGYIWFQTTGSYTGLNVTIDNVSVKEAIDGDFDFTRNSSATRVNSQGLIEDMQILSSNLVSNGDFSQEGAEQVTNGNFATDSDWNLGTGWSIGSGVATCDGTNGALLFQSLSGTTTNDTFKVTYTISNYISGSVFVGFGSGLNQPNGTTRNSNGTYTEYLTKTSTSTSFGFKSASFIGSIDNVSVKEVGQDWTLGTGWSIEDGKVYFDNPTGTELYQSLSTTASKYRISFDLDITSGTIQTSFSSPSTSTIESFTTSGTKTVDITTTASFSRFRFVGIGGSVFNIDNVSVIEITDDTNLPRIDYTGGEGHWLFEPQSTNKIIYSEDFTQWNKSSAITVTSNAINSPSGNLNASLLSTTTTNRFIYLTTSSAANSTFSIYVKWKNGSGDIDLSVDGASNYTSVSVTSEWTRVSITPSSSITQVVLRIPTASELYVWGAQVEAQSFATSIIPTNGSTVTRLKDAAFGAGSSDLINSTEGVLYFEGSALTNETDVNKTIGISNASSSNRVQLTLHGTPSRISFYGTSSEGFALSYSNFSYNKTEPLKIAVKWKIGDVGIFINGIKVYTGTPANTFLSNTLNTLSFADYNNIGSPFYGKTKCVAVFKEALTDEELECLTTI